LNRKRSDTVKLAALPESIDSNEPKKPRRGTLAGVVELVEEMGR